MKRKFTMKMMMFLAVFLIAANRMNAQDNVAPSTLPPGGIAPADAPMFVVIGWDDNMFADGINWIRDFIKDKKNANGTPARNTFFLIGNGGTADNYDDGGGHQTGDDVLNAWRNLYADGHEIGNHTMTHPDGGAANYTETQWQNTMDSCRNFVHTNVGVPLNELKGFRTPFLDYNCATYDAIKQEGFLYDCSIEWGYDGYSLPAAPWWASASDTNTYKNLIFWPFTLDNGPAPGSTAKCKSSNINVPGLWEFPVYVYFGVGCTQKLTGFDYNLWAAPLSGDQFYNNIKYDFDLRHRGNKVPFMLDVHTDNYSDWNSATSVYTASTTATRRKAIEDFINYVLQYPDVRVVTFTDVIKWMRNPKPYANDNAGPFTVTVNATNGSVQVSPQQAQYTKGSGITLTATPATDYVFTGWNGGATGTTNPLTVTVNSDLNITANFKYEPATCAKSLDVMATASFTGAHDDLGSMIDTVIEPNNGMIDITWNLVKQPNDSTWPWCEIGIGLASGTLEGACSIEISYKSDQPLSLSLPQAGPLADNGESYMILLPVSTTTTTIKKDLTAFAQPSWSTHKTIALDQSAITSLTIAPSIDDQSVASNGTFEISSLKIYGIGTLGVQDYSVYDNTLSIFDMNRNSMKISSVKNGSYAIQVYGMDGRLVNDICQNLNTGVNPVSFNTSLQPGLYIVKLTGNEGAITKKFAVTK